MAPTSVFLSSGSPTRSVDRRSFELVEQRLVDRSPGRRAAAAGAADLALVEEDAVDDALDGLVERRVVEDDVGRLAAELQRQRLVRAGHGAADLLADGRGAGERHLVHVGMLDQGKADLARAGDDVDDARRQVRLAARRRRRAAPSAASCSAGLRTTVLPAASAGAIFQASISSGKFHGMTCAATPSGCGVRPGKAYSSLSAQPA